ncbi:phage tail tape measure protein [Anaerorhabdus sp.]|uniref:phage tail tape measure protein n=1 Tax=Anaerorhabdus sp. TaxID=1872524 RepID=UPI002FCB8A6B
MSKQRVDGSVIIDVEADLSKFQTQISKIAKVGTITLTAIVGSASLSTKAIYDVGTSFESAFAGVKKTVNASAAELEGFRKEILNLSTEIPQTADGIASIAEAAGQLGIKNNALMGFTRTMADLGVATNMGATEAATTLARFANITQMSQDNFGRLGSTIVELGNNLATTEAEIADMALNIAGAGHQVGMTEPQILALSAALSSVGIEAAAGGTAMSTLMIEIKKATVLGGKDLEKFANVANMSSKDFKNAFNDDAGKAIQTFIEGLGTASERGVDAIELLNDAGLTEVRMTRALLNAANASEVFSNSFDLANQAWDENIALTKEASQRYETTEAKMQILNNAIAKAGITAFEKFKEPFKEAIDTGIDSVNELTKSFENGKLGHSVDNIAKSFNDLLKTTIEVGTKALPPLIDGMAWVMDNADVMIAGILGVAIATKGLLIVNKAATSIEFFRYQMALASKTVNLTGKALQVYTAKALIADKANKLLGVSSGGLYMILGAVAVAGLAALTVGLIKYNKKLNESIEIEREKNKAVKESIEALEERQQASKKAYESSLDEIVVLEDYYNAIKRNTDANGVYTGDQEKLNTMLKKLNDSFPELNASYDLNTGKILDQKGEVLNLTDAIGKLIEAKRVEAYLEAYKEDYVASIRDRQEAVKQLTDDIQRLEEVQGKLSEVDYQKLISFKDDGNMDGYKSYLESLGFTYDELVKLNEEQSLLNERIADNTEVIKANDEIKKSYESILTAFESGNIEEAMRLMYGGGELVLYDSAKGQEQVLALETQVSDIEKTIKTLEQLKISNPELAEVFQEQIDLMKEKLLSANEELAAAQLQHDSAMSEQATTAGDLQAAAFNAAYLPTAKIGMSTSGTESGKAFETAVKAIVSAITFAPLYVDIYARKHGFDDVSGGATSGASYDDTQEPYRIIQPDYGRMVNMARNVFSGVQNRVARSVTLPSQNLVLQSGGGNTEVTQNIAFNQPVKKPSDITRAMNKASKELKKAK